MEPKGLDIDLRSVYTYTGTSSSGDGMMTPTSSCFETRLDNKHKNAVPCPGKTYRIHLLDTDKVLMVIKGQVELQPIAEAKLGGGWHWHCEERSNWLTFRNHVSGNYLGYNKSNGVHAQAAWCRPDEHFCVRSHPDGGYLMLANCSRDVQLPALLQIGCAPGKSSLQGVQKGGAQWVFEEV